MSKKKDRAEEQAEGAMGGESVSAGAARSFAPDQARELDPSPRTRGLRRPPSAG